MMATSTSVASRCQSPPQLPVPRERPHGSGFGVAIASDNRTLVTAAGKQVRFGNCRKAIPAKD